MFMCGEPYPYFCMWVGGLSAFFRFPPVLTHTLYSERRVTLRVLSVTSGTRLPEACLLRKLERLYLLSLVLSRPRYVYLLQRPGGGACLMHQDNITVESKGAGSTDT